MSDGFVLIRPGRPVWVGCNIDGDPGVPRVIDVRLPANAGESAVILERGADSRRHSFGGAGVNEAGLAVLCQPAPTRFDRLGWGRAHIDERRADLLARALIHCTRAEEALEFIIAEHSRDRGDDYGHHDGACILCIDSQGAWLLELAGGMWAAARVRGRRVISGALTLENDFDRIHPRALEFARRRDWARSGLEFGFTRSFGDPGRTLLRGTSLRRQNTLHRLLGTGELAGNNSLTRVLRDHAGGEPDTRMRPPMTCSHRPHPGVLDRLGAPEVSPWQAQTAMSLLVALPRADPLSGESKPCEVWATGTPAPCLSVFKPVPFDADAWAAIAPDGGEASWRALADFHELVIRDWRGLRSLGEAQREALEARAFEPARDPGETAALWAEHRRALGEWTATAKLRAAQSQGILPRLWPRKT